MPLKNSDTFFLKNTGGIANPAGAHLMICMLARNRDQRAVIIPVVSRLENSDTSCVLNVGDHPFIRHESCVAYGFTRLIPAVDIEADIASGDIVLQATISAEVLKRVQIGFVTSDELEPWAFDAGHGADLLKVLEHQGYI